MNKSACIYFDFKVGDLLPCLREAFGLGGHGHRLNFRGALLHLLPSMCARNIISHVLISNILLYISPFRKRTQGSFHLERNNIKKLKTVNY